MKVTYTDAAVQELKKFEGRQKRLLEELIAERKYVFGDEVLEITASDIKENADLIRPISRVRSRFRTTRFIGRVYIVVGSLIGLGSAVYPYFDRLLQQNRSQALLFLAGIGMALTGVFGLFYANLRERKYELFDRELHRFQAEKVMLKPKEFLVEVDEDTRKT